MFTYFPMYNVLFKVYSVCNIIWTYGVKRRGGSDCQPNEDRRSKGKMRSFLN